MLVYQRVPIVAFKHCSGGDEQHSEERKRMRQTCETALTRLELQYTNLELLPEDLDVERGSIKSLVYSWQFRWLVFCVIFWNMVIVSVVESIWEYDQISHVTLMVERVALAFYMVELGLRLCAGQGRTRFWWIILDLVLVIVGILALFIPTALCFSHVCTYLQRYMLTVRLVRLLKLVRISKDERKFHPMWVLFDGICHAFPTILASTIFVVIVIAIFAGLLISLLHEDQGIMTDPVLAELVHRKFDSFPTALLSLVQFVSGDDLADMYYPLMLARPELSLIFMPLFVLVTIGLMNLVPAILLENAARQKEYKQITGQLRFQKLSKKLEKVLTADGVTEVSHGLLSTADITETLGDFKLDQLFNVLVRKLCPDDDDPKLPVDEFLEAVMELLVLEVPMSTMETLAILRRLSARVAGMEKRLAHLESQKSMEKLRDSMDDLHEKVDAIQQWMVGMGPNYLSLAV